MSELNVDVWRKKLETRLAALESRLHEIEDDLDQPSSPDTEERATEREGDEVLEGLGQAGLQEIDLIRKALDRIEKGTYGICVTCGDAISEGRLEAVPHATQCRNCAN